MHLAPRQWHAEDLAPYNGTDPQKPSLATNILGNGTGIHILIILLVLVYCYILFSNLDSNLYPSHLCLWSQCRIWTRGRRKNMQKRKEEVMKQVRATWTNTAMQRLAVCVYVWRDADAGKQTYINLHLEIVLDYRWIQWLPWWYVNGMSMGCQWDVNGCQWMSMGLFGEDLPMS